MPFSLKSDISFRDSAALDGGAGTSAHSSNGPRPGLISTLPDLRTPSHVTPRVIRTRPIAPIDDKELHERIGWQELLSPHFAFEYDPEWFPVRQAQAILDQLEETYSLIFHLTHESFKDRWNVYAADHRSPLVSGHGVRSHLNLSDRSLCLIQTSSHHLYGDLALLLTHAMRAHRYSKHYESTTGWASLEDAFAIFLNERLSIQPDVFPFFGADPDLIAHHLYSHHSYASISRSWPTASTGRRLNDLVLFGAFFLYLGDTFSDDRIVEFSKIDGPVSSSEFNDFFGASLDELEHAWIAHLPVSRISSTQEEQEQMVLRWDRAIDGERF